MFTLTITDRCTPRSGHFANQTNENTETHTALTIFDAWTFARYNLRAIGEHDRLDIGYMFAMGDHNILGEHRARADHPDYFRELTYKVTQG